MNRSAWTPLYAQLKDLVCCSLSNDVRSIWISWTAASAAAGMRAPCISLTDSLLLNASALPWLAPESFLLLRMFVATTGSSVLLLCVCCCVRATALHHMASKSPPQTLGPERLCVLQQGCSACC